MTASGHIGPDAATAAAGVDHVAGRTHHGRAGAVENAFDYRVDYVMLDPEAEVSARWPFARNRRGAVALHDADHGGPPGAGRGAVWLRDVLAAKGLSEVAPGRVLLLAQPRVLGHVFNPVSFWFCHDAAGALRVVVPEVTNTFGDRRSYLCHRDDLGPIEPSDVLTATKALHVSPFQPVEGGYRFRFDLREDRVGIWIDYRGADGARALYATLTGRRRPLTRAAMLRICVARPFGSRRVLALIHWQALRLWWRGAPFRSRPAPRPGEIGR